MEKKSFNGNTAILRILNVSEMGADRRPPAAFILRNLLCFWSTYIIRQPIS